MYVCVHLRMYICTHVCAYVCMYVRMHVCMYVYMYIYMNVCRFLFVHLCAYMYACILMYMLQHHGAGMGNDFLSLSSPNLPLPFHTFSSLYAYLALQLRGLHMIEARVHKLKKHRVNRIQHRFKMLLIGFFWCFKSLFSRPQLLQHKPFILLCLPFANTVLRVLLR